MLLQLWMTQLSLTFPAWERREAAEEGAEGRWRQNCGKSDQDPASTWQNRSLQWAFHRAALEVVLRPYQCGPAISDGQRSNDTETNDKAPHNVSCIRSGSQRRWGLRIILQESTSLCITVSVEVSFTIFTPRDYDIPWLEEQPANRWVKNGLHMLFGIWFYSILWRQKNYAFWRIYFLEIIYFTLKENQS